MFEDLVYHLLSILSYKARLSEMGSVATVNVPWNVSLCGCAIINGANLFGGSATSACLLFSATATYIRHVFKDSALFRLHELKSMSAVETNISNDFLIEISQNFALYISTTYSDTVIFLLNKTADTSIGLL